MENLVNALESFRGKRVLITGDTGFKGSWMALWLEKMGAQVYGYSLAMEGTNHLDLLHLKMDSQIGDIRDLNSLQNYFDKVQPDIVFHLAAQALVRLSYDIPVETYEVNLMGTINVMGGFSVTNRMLEMFSKKKKK